MTQTPSDSSGPTPGQPAGPQPPGSMAQPTRQDRDLAMLCHLLGIVGLVAPLIIWAVKRDQSPFVDSHGKEAVNFQLTVMIASIAATASLFVLIGFVLLPAVGVANIIFCILAGMEANKGLPYRYPISIRFIQ